MTQNNLGIAYRELPTGDRAANLARAIELLHRGAAVPHRRGRPGSSTPRPRTTWAPPTPSFRPGTGRPTWPGRSSCYTQALRFYTAEAAPAEYATTQNNLGIAYAELPTGDRAANLARAIECYTQALRFRTAEAAPARVRRDPEQPGQRLPGASDRGPGGQPGPGDRLLHPGAAVPYRRSRPGRVRRDPAQPGQRLRELPAGDRAANLARAIDCYTQALRFHTAEAAPADCRITALSLGDLHFGQDRWAEAHTAYSLAIRAGEFLYQATGSEVGRQAELGAAGNAVAADAYCLARLGRLAEAVQRLEAGRARALGEALARDRAASAGGQ